MRVGLRVDVDTFRGTRVGVPALCETLARHSILASFFFSVGPDNMGRHLWRLLRPAFLAKMLRSGAPGLYGWDILLRGVFMPGPLIGRELAPVIRAAADAGHECGFHAWDHQRWQACAGRMSAAETRSVLARGTALLEEITGRKPAASAAPGWKGMDELLEAEAGYPFRYNSDCRGDRIFLPVVAGRRLRQPQIPVTLPTYDEVIGRNGITDAGYNEFMLSMLRPGGLNVLAIHAEVEGGARAGLFDGFMRAARGKGVQFVPLGELSGDWPEPGPGTMIRGTAPGREGWVSVLGAA